MTINDAVQCGTLLAVAVAGFMNRWYAKKATKVSDKIHMLVNSNMEVQLRVNWLQARRIADMTKLPSDIALAEEAEKLYNRHKIKDSAANEI